MANTALVRLLAALLRWPDGVRGTAPSRPILCLLAMLLRVAELLQAVAGVSRRQDGIRRAAAPLVACWLVCFAAPALAGLVLDPDDPEPTTVPPDVTMTWICYGSNGEKRAGSPLAACKLASDLEPKSEPPYFIVQINRCDEPVFNGNRTFAQAQCYGTKQYISPYGPGQVTSDSPVATAEISKQCENATDSGVVCTCKPGFSPDVSGKKCTPKCDKGTLRSSGFFDLGPNAGATPQLLGCQGECAVTFDGVSPAGSSLVDGVKHWYAKGSYYNTGKKCSATQQSALDVGQATQTKPPDGCGKGQGMISMNGRTQCVDQNGDLKSPTPESTPKQETKTEKTTATNPDGSTTTTEKSTSVDANGNKETTITRTTTRPDGSSSVEVEKVGDKPSSGSPSSENPSEEPQKGECEKNPSAAGCGGQPSPVGSLYDVKDKTLGTLLEGHRAAFLATPAGGAVTNFFSVSGGGGCPTWSSHIPYINADIVIDQFCSPFATTALAIFKACLLVVASFFAFRIAIE